MTATSVRSYSGQAGCVGSATTRVDAELSRLWLFRQSCEQGVEIFFSIVRVVFTEPLGCCFCQEAHVAQGAGPGADVASRRLLSQRQDTLS